MKKITEKQLKELRKILVLDVVNQLHDLCPKSKSGRHYPSIWKGMSGRGIKRCDCCGMYMNY